ncbi:MAG: WYL domain-containing protein [Cyanobacteria bacterium SIG32]|nr:WYL domain-containing protein [Cyanobacteria bacterium SIG32]
MKEFLQSNKVTYNLMSFTAFKSILLFSYLLEKPRSYEEIRDYFAQHEYLNETISIDTLRVYINSLERVGCEVVRGKKAEGSKYRIVKHPFELKFSDEQVKSIIKVYKMLLKSIEVEELLSLTKFFKKISRGVENLQLKQLLAEISPLNKLNIDILLPLIKACRKNDEITIMYNSPRSGIKKIDLLAENLVVSNNKIYLNGKSPMYTNNASFLVSRIVEPPVVKLEKTIDLPDESQVVGCEIYDMHFVPQENDKILQTLDDKLIVEISADNKFYARQRILALGSDCKVLYPESFREDVLSTLKRIKEEYVTEKI